MLYLGPSIDLLIRPSLEKTYSTEPLIYGRLRLPLCYLSP